jgi:hypothetical protein
MDIEALPNLQRVLNDEVTELLEAGLAKVKKGWCQHDWIKINGDVCALGAIGYRYDSLDSDIIRRTARDVLLTLIQEKRPGYFQVGDWNDAKTRTKQDVIELYERAVEVLKNRKILLTTTPTLTI